MYVYLNKSRYHFNGGIDIYLYLRIQTSYTHTHVRDAWRTEVAEGDRLHVAYCFDAGDRVSNWWGIYLHLELHRLRERRHQRFLEIRHYSDTQCIPWRVFSTRNWAKHTRNASVHVVTFQNEASRCDRRPRCLSADSHWLRCLGTMFVTRRSANSVEPKCHCSAVVLTCENIFGLKCFILLQISTYIRN